LWQDWRVWNRRYDYVIQKSEDRRDSGANAAAQFI
jgi:hypothetical protein